MLLKLIRNAPQGKALFGQLYVDGKSFCDTLENTDYAIPAGFYRLDVTFSPRWQVLLPILYGVWGYRKSKVESQKSKVNEKSKVESQSTQRTGIRIHAGNTIDHTEGCILVGERDPTPNPFLNAPHEPARFIGDPAKGEEEEQRLLSSAKTLHRLREYLLNYMNQNPNEEVYIEISEPDPYPLYDAYCAPELQQHAIDARYELKRQRDLHAQGRKH
jgi:hypothetical protein